MKAIVALIPFFLFASELMHPEDPKSRDLNSLGFGLSGDVAISDGIYFVGQTSSPLNNGSIYIYTLSDSQEMNQREILAPITNELGFDFGYSVAVDGLWLVIGAPHRGNLEGRVFIYRKSAENQWLLFHTVNNGKRSKDFGSKVAISNNHIFIGDRDINDEKGSVFTLSFDSKANMWKENGALFHNGLSPDSFFGHDIALDGDRAIVGSRNGNIAIYYRFENETWQEKQVLTPDRYQSKGRFGFSVALNGDKAAIGYPGYDEKGLIQIYNFSENNWNKIQTILNPDDDKGTYFGNEIALDHDNLLTGNYNGEKAFLYNNDGKSFNLIHGIQSPDTNEGKFGRSLDINDDMIIVGATYGQIAHIYTKDIQGAWGKSHSVSSKDRIFSKSGELVPCVNGKSGDYDCKGIDMMSFISPSDLSGGVNTELNDIWGWTDPTTKKEYAIVGLRIGTSFVDVTDPVNPIVVGMLPTATSNSTWRDIKVYKDHAYIVADNAGNHGVQVFDLKQLRGLSSFNEFKMNYHYTNVGSVHNIAINEETGFAYATGISSADSSDFICGGGLHIIDLSDPGEPSFAGCFAHAGTGRSGSGYTHDAQVVIYDGPDKDYTGKEIAFSSNETALSIADVSDKSNPLIISKFDNMQFGYVHQGWLSKDHRYFFVNDELNEYQGPDKYQTTLIFDLRNLDEPEILTVYRSNLQTIDHNNYVVDNLLYQSNYSTGLRVINIQKIQSPTEVAYFDTYISGDIVDFVGSWSNYPYLKSGTLLVSSIEEGLYVLKATDGGTLTTTQEKNKSYQFILKENYPNPFNPITSIEYELPIAGNVELIVFNTLGKEVAKIDWGYKVAGRHHSIFDGSQLPSGVYFYQLKAGEVVQTRKMSLIK